MVADLFPYVLNEGD